jgi:hypothetical protein
MFTLRNISCWYWVVALFISGYQAYRGYKLQSLLGVGSKWSRANRTVLLCIADMLTYLFCALSGFYSLLLFYRAANLNSVPPTPVEHPAFLIFLLAYGVLGVTGKLPDSLNRLKVPSSE